jgi:hypothetical protein
LVVDAMQKYILCAFFLALCAVLIPIPVQAQGGCVGGKCGVTATVTPNSGPSGTQITIRLESGAYPLDGKYEIWWSKTPTMQSDDPTVVKLAEGWNQRMQKSMELSLSIPEASNGTSYLHYIKSGRSEQMMNFAFQVTPGLIAREDKARPRSTLSLTGTGFTPDDQITLSVDGEACELAVKSDRMGAFTADLPMPDVMAGTHVIKATAKKMYNQDATLRIKVVPFIKVEPAMPMVGKTATVSGYGFAGNSEVSIRYDSATITSSPTSDKNGRFVYNFEVPETSDTQHKLVATDKAGNQAVYELPVENNPPTTPTPISPTSDRFGIFGSQPVTFTWMPARDDSGAVVYTVEVADNLNFFPLMPGMRRSNLESASVTLQLEPGTYYWRVQSADPSGNKSKWALSPYAFQVGLINIWIIIGASLVLLIVFILLLRAFIQRVRGYYY